MWMSFALGCFVGSTATGAGPADSADEVAAPPRESRLADAGARIVGEASSASGNALALGDDPEGDGAAIIVAAYFRGIVCEWKRAPVGTVPLTDADACIRSDAQAEYLGFAVAAGADLTGDGVADIVASAIGDSSAGPYTGRVDVYAGPLPAGDSLPGIAVARAFGDVSGDYAGSALAGAGDTDGDSALEILVGASASDAGGSGSGAVYLLEAPFESAPPAGRSLGEIATATIVGEGAAAEAPPPPHAPPADGDNVGAALAAGGDLDGDGLDDIALGANGRDPDGVSNAGVVAGFLGPIAGAFTLDDADWTWTGTRIDQFLGDAVACVGDVDGDGDDDLAAAAVTEGNGTTWILGPPGPVTTAWAYAEGEQDGDEAGAAIASAGDVDGDGSLDVLVGAYRSDVPAGDAGSAYLWLGPFEPGRFSLADAAWIGRGERDGDSAGRAVAAGRDLDGDGGPDLAIGAMYYDGDAAFTGATYLVTGLYSR